MNAISQECLEGISSISRIYWFRFGGQRSLRPHEAVSFYIQRVKGRLHSDVTMSLKKKMFRPLFNATVQGRQLVSRRFLFLRLSKLTLHSTYLDACCFTWMFDRRCANRSLYRQLDDCCSHLLKADHTHPKSHQKTYGMCSYMIMWHHGDTVVQLRWVWCGNLKSPVHM